MIEPSVENYMETLCSVLHWFNTLRSNQDRLDVADDISNAFYWRHAMTWANDPIDYRYVMWLQVNVVKYFFRIPRAIQLTNGLEALLISDGLPKWRRDSGCEDGSGANERLVSGIQINLYFNGRMYHDDVVKWKLFRVTGPLCGEYTGHRWIPLTRPVTRNFDIFFDLRPNKRLSKQSWGWWFSPTKTHFIREICPISPNERMGLVYVWGTFQLFPSPHLPWWRQGAKLLG